MNTNKHRRIVFYPINLLPCYYFSYYTSQLDVVMPHKYWTVSRGISQARPTITGPTASGPSMTAGLSKGTRMSPSFSGMEAFRGGNLFFTLVSLTLLVILELTKL